MYSKSRVHMFELDRLHQYDQVSLIAELRRVSDLVPAEALTISAFQAYSKASRSTITRHFGSWGAALEAAGLQHRIHPKIRNRSNPEIIKDVRKLANSLGSAELTVREVSEHLGISFRRLRKEFGNSKNLFDAAGLKIKPVGRRYSEDECFTNLLTLWTYYGRRPQFRELSQPPSTVGGKAYIKRFGSWNKALFAFVESVNAGPSEASKGEDVSIALQTKREVHEKVRAQGPRDAPLSLRFRVLRRDSFRCVLCGDNPSANPTCVLNVDHVTPYSKGGATIEQNLRTLCASCNLGRSNRYED